MRIVHKKRFYQGLALLVSFAILFWTMMLPLFHDSEGGKLNSLQYADTIFNELSKGSSWFIPEVLANLKGAEEMRINVKVKFADTSLVPVAMRELGLAGAGDIAYADGALAYSGNLASILRAATEDAAALYNTDDEAISKRYGSVEPLQISRAWWNVLNPAIRELQKKDDLQAASLVEQVVRRAIEPGNNFYGLPSARVSENIFLVCALLAFYVLYAIWYGFAIYHLFDGFGLLGESEAVENVEESEI
ncbi:MAG: hypothetical protein HDQ91_00045 [Desulfovibrio sp.]|nr:hypothetical protein [Desulfovibrio sp.]